MTGQKMHGEIERVLAGEDLTALVLCHADGRRDAEGPDKR
jgi:hypothetical protein